MSQFSRIHNQNHIPSGNDNLPTDFYHGVISRLTTLPLPTTLTTTTFTLATATTNLSYYYQGILKIVTTNRTTVLAGTAGLYYIFFDSSDVLQNSTSFPALSTTVSIATVYWNGSNLGLVQDERHSSTRDLEWHAWTHSSVGARYNAGLDFSLTGIATTNLNTTFNISSGGMKDEDISFVISATTNCRIFYQTSLTIYTFVPTLSTLPYYYSSGIIAVNASTYALSSGVTSSSRYFNYFLYSSTDIGCPIYCFCETVLNASIGGYTSASNARAVPPPSLANFGLTSEMKLLYRIVVNGAGLVQTPISTDDFRNSSTIASGGVASSSAASVSFSPSTLLSTNVQSAIEEVSNNTLSLASSAAATAISGHTTTIDHAPIAHSNRTALNLVSGTNTGDQTLAGLGGLALTGGTIHPATDVTNTFRVETAASESVLSVDTVSKFVVIGPRVYDTGLGTRLNVRASVVSDPATSGTTQSAGAILRLGMDGSNGVVDWGKSQAVSGAFWLQVCNAASLGICYPILLNPNGGNVSIGTGTTTPTEKLHVVGNALIKPAAPTASNALVVQAATSTTNVFSVVTTNNTAVVNIAAGSKYQIGGVDLAATDIGALPLTGGTLTGAITGNSASGPSAVKFAIKPDVDSTKAIQFQKADGSTNILSIDSTNNRVGVNTVLPTSTLTVTSPDQSAFKVISNNNNMMIDLNLTGTAAYPFGIRLIYGVSTVVGWFFSDAVNGWVGISNTYTDVPQLSINKTTGNVGIGIGKTTASEKLHVVGNAFIKSATDNATAFRVEKTAAATAVFAVDTSANKAVATQYALSGLNTAPASATATGVLGEIRVTADAIYICTATNTWVKTNLATW